MDCKILILGLVGVQKISIGKGLELKNHTLHGLDFHIYILNFFWAESHSTKAWPKVMSAQVIKTDKLYFSLVIQGASMQIFDLSLKLNKTSQST